MAIPFSPSLSGVMPHPRTRFIGREGECERARVALLHDAVALLTLTGPGGVGKTRLALAISTNVAKSFSDGVVWVDLSLLTDPAPIRATIATALGLVSAPGRPIAEQLASHLQTRQTLLILDNCEHLLTHVAEVVAHLLEMCPALQILATSRAPLRVRGEQVLPVEPLPLPPAELTLQQAIAENPAVRLFLDRSQAANSASTSSPVQLPVIAALCRHLDGLPLAIELAATCATVLSPEALLAQMTRRLPLLSQGPRDLPDRQQTIRATIQWSYDLLTPEARALFRHLTVFVGGFTLEAAQNVAGNQDQSREDVLNNLTLLVTHSLVRRVEGVQACGDPRFSMLETIREFGLEQLIAHSEDAEFRTSHARYFLTLVDEINARVATHLPEAGQVLDQLEIEHPNLRAALHWFAFTGASEDFVTLAGTMHAFWLHHGYTREGRQWLEQAVAQREGVSQPARVWALVGLFAMLWTQQAEEERALDLIAEAVALAHASGDPLSVGLANQWHSSADRLLHQLSNAERSLNASRAAFSSLPPAPWVSRDLAHIDAWISYCALLRGDVPEAELGALAALKRERELEQEHEAPYPYVSLPQTVLGHIARIRGNPVLALSRYQGALEDAVPRGSVREVISALGGIAGSLAAVGRWAEAARLFGATESVCEQSGFDFHVHVLDWQRVLGLPEPWEQARASFGLLDELHQVIQGQARESPPPLPDPAATDRHWADGRKMPLAEAITHALAMDLAAPSPFPPKRVPAADPDQQCFALSPRENEVLALLCQRLSDAEIAEALCISPRTASRHVANIFNKLGVNSRREAALRAAQSGLVCPLPIKGPA